MVIYSAQIGMIFIRVIQVWTKILALTTILLIASNVQADAPIPPLKSHVTDLTATLSTQDITRLDEKLTAFEKKKGSQVAVLIVPTTQPETIEQYSMRVVEIWKLGRKNIDDGALLLIAKKDRALRIEVGYGLEGVLPDATAKRIIEEIIVPQFKTANFVNGIDAGVHAILSVIEGEPLPLPQARQGYASSNNTHLIDNIVFILVGFFVFGRILQSWFGRIAGASVTSIGAGIVGWLLFSSLAIAAIIAVAAFFFGLFQHVGNGIYRNGRHDWSRGNHWGGGIGGGFGGSGGGFGGGGASGRW